jgi:eukaryotic-like serine/threonine-protein kinase
MQGALDLAPDTLVAGRYRLSDPLASGSTASVWRAVDIRSGRDVAMKILRDEGVDPNLRARAEREATVLTGISHPNLVQVIDSGSDDGHPYLVMALLEGEALNRIIATRGRLPVDEAVSLVAEVAEGLGVAHEAGVVHRDVKPGNIVCHEQVPTLVDFGIARAMDATTLTRGLVVGTASYLAPEQAQGLAITPAADVYSLSCVLYELLTGRPPFTGDSPVTIALKHVQESPVPPGDVADVPAEVGAVVMQGLSKDPTLRPADGGALAVALRRSLEQHTGDETRTIARSAPIDGTTVMPAVSLASAAAIPEAEADLIDPSPLAEPAGEERPAPGRPNRAVGIVLAIAATVIFVALLASILGGDGGGGERVVPKVAGGPVSQVTAYLDAAGFDVDVRNVSSDQPAGTVLASDPPAGESIGDGDTLSLSVSSGPVTTTTVAPPTTAPPAPAKGNRKAKHGDD